MSQTRPALDSAEAAPAAAKGSAGRGLLLERAAAGLAHEGKNPLHTMALHLHLLADKLARQLPGEASMERHAQALRDGIGKVDALLRAFADLAAPANAEPDLGGALQRALLLFAYEARRTGGIVAEPRGVRVARVDAPGSVLSDLVAHAVLAAVTLSRGGGTISTDLRAGETRAELVVESHGGAGEQSEAAPHVDAVRRLSLDLGAELSIAASAVGSARLSISLPRAR